MKRIVSVSIGSSKRDHRAEVDLLGEHFVIERIGTDGDLDRAIALVEELDGKVDAFGLGGIDLYICFRNRRYTFRDARRIARAARHTPIVDGSGLKDTLERHVVAYLQENLGINLAGKRVLMVSAADRFGMAEAFSAAGCDMIFGDLIFALGVPVPLHSLEALAAVARVAAPFVVRLPFCMLYPTGAKQEAPTKPRHTRYYHWADIIAGDYHFIRKHMPEKLPGKIIVTNTVTTLDIDEMRKRGVKTLITSTPNLNGRSFGTNVMEAVVVALLGRPPAEIQPEDYWRVLQEIKFVPRVENLQAEMPA